MSIEELIKNNLLGDRKDFVTTRIYVGESSYAQIDILKKNENDDKYKYKWTIVKIGDSFFWGLFGANYYFRIFYTGEEDFPRAGAYVIDIWANPKISRSCPSCFHKGNAFGSVNVVTVDPDKYWAWRSGVNEFLIQEALPDNTPAEREILITGICNDCFSEIREKGSEMEREPDYEGELAAENYPPNQKDQ